MTTHHPSHLGTPAARGWARTLTVMVSAALLATAAASAAKRPMRVTQAEIARGTQMCEKADKLLAGGKPREALAMYRKVLKFLPQSPRAYQGATLCKQRLSGATPIRAKAGAVPAPAGLKGAGSAATAPSGSKGGGAGPGGKPAADEKPAGGGSPLLLLGSLGVAGVVVVGLVLRSRRRQSAGAAVAVPLDFPGPKPEAPAEDLATVAAAASATAAAAVQSPSPVASGPADGSPFDLGKMGESVAVAAMAVEPPAEASPAPASAAASAVVAPTSVPLAVEAPAVEPAEAVVPSVGLAGAAPAGETAPLDQEPQPAPVPPFEALDAPAAVEAVAGPVIGATAAVEGLPALAAEAEVDAVPMGFAIAAEPDAPPSPFPFAEEPEVTPAPFAAADEAAPITAPFAAADEDEARSLSGVAAVLPVDAPSAPEFADEQEAAPAFAPLGFVDEEDAAPAPTPFGVIEEDEPATVSPFGAADEPAAALSLFGAVADTEEEAARPPAIAGLDEEPPAPTPFGPVGDEEEVPSAFATAFGPIDEEEEALPAAFTAAAEPMAEAPALAGATSPRIDLDAAAVRAQEWWQGSARASDTCEVCGGILVKGEGCRVGGSDVAASRSYLEFASQMAMMFGQDRDAALQEVHDRLDSHPDPWLVCEQCLSQHFAA